MHIMYTFLHGVEIKRSEQNYFILLPIFIYDQLEPELWRFTVGSRVRCCACPALPVGLVNRKLFEARALSLFFAYTALSKMGICRVAVLGAVLIIIGDTWTWQWSPCTGLKDKSPFLDHVKEGQSVAVSTASDMGSFCLDYGTCVRLINLQSQIFGAFTPPVSLLLDLNSTQKIVLEYVQGIAFE